MDEDKAQSLQTLVDYYRNKSSQLELDYVQFQITSSHTINSLTEQLEVANAALASADSEPAKRTKATDAVTEGP